MNVFRLKYLAIVLILAIAWGCDRDEESPIRTNNSVLPEDFLSEETFKSLVVEVAYVEGHAPVQAALTNLKTFLEQRLNKSGGITIKQKSFSSPGRETIDADAIREMEKTHRSENVRGNTLTAFIFYLDAEYSRNSGNSKVLGVAYGASSLAVFETTVEQASGGLNQPSGTALETTILNHEFGHILGLVNRGTEMVSPHEDPAHEAHCSDTKCLMYYKAESAASVGDLTGTSAPSLDANCIADLRRAGGK